MAKGAYIGVDGVARKVKNGYIGIDGIARKIKKAYIGVVMDTPVYEESSTTITENNFADFFDIVHTNSNGNGFTFSGDTLAATTVSLLQVVSNSTLTAKVDIATLSFDYAVGNKGTGDPYLTITVAGTEVVNATTEGQLVLGAALLMKERQSS